MLETSTILEATAGLHWSVKAMTSLAALACVGAVGTVAWVDENPEGEGLEWHRATQLSEAEEAEFQRASRLDSAAAAAAEDRSSRALGRAAKVITSAESPRGARAGDSALTASGEGSIQTEDELSEVGRASAPGMLLVGQIGRFGNDRSDRRSRNRRSRGSGRNDPDDPIEPESQDGEAEGGASIRDYLADVDESPDAVRDEWDIAAAPSNVAFTEAGIHLLAWDLRDREPRGSYLYILQQDEQGRLAQVHRYFCVQRRLDILSEVCVPMASVYSNAGTPMAPGYSADGHLVVTEASDLDGANFSRLTSYVEANEMLLAMQEYFDSLRG